MKKVSLAAILLLLIVTLISGPTFAAKKMKLDIPHKIPTKITGGTNSKKGGTFMYEAYEPNHINPITYRQAGSIEILAKWTFETLLATDVATGEDIPLIAKKWAISKNGKVFTFWIDEKAKWHDGKSITAADVKFSFDVFSMEGIHSPFRKAKAHNFSKIEVVDKRIVRFEAKNRDFSNFEFLIHTLIIPKHLYYYKDAKKMETNQYTKIPKGSGAYVVEAWKKGDRAVLKKNKKYWGAHLPQNKNANNFDEVIIRYIRDPQIAFEKVKKGDIDYMPIRIGNTELWRQTKTDKAFKNGKLEALKVISKLQQGYGFIAYNLKNEIFKDKKVRKALAKAINRPEMIKKSLDGLARIPYGPLYSVDNFVGTFSPVTYNPAEALKELAAAGWTDSDGDYILDKNGKKFVFTVLVPNPRIEKEMLFVQSYWENIGVKAVIKKVEYSTWRQLQDERKFDAISNGKGRTLNARGVNPYGEWHSDNLPSGLRNYYGYSNKEVDILISKAVKELDQKKRKGLLDKVNDLIAESYIMFQYSESTASLHAVSSKIKLPTFNNTKWFPYDLGIKYWSIK